MISIHPNRSAREKETAQKGEKKVIEMRITLIALPLNKRLSHIVDQWTNEFPHDQSKPAATNTKHPDLDGVCWFSVSNAHFLIKTTAGSNGEVQECDIEF